jgi:DNA-binding transcriptional ArsR family regulator
VSKAPYTIEDRETARAILRYLVKHPEAKDTAEGIAQWWVEGERSERVNVERAVSWLLSQGVILETRRKGLPPYYRLNAKQSAAALKILREL